MKGTWSRILFPFTTFVFFLIIAIFSMLLLQAFASPKPGLDGVYRGGGFGPIGGVLHVALALIVADRSVSWLFFKTGLSGPERWSVFRQRRKVP